jgi:sarcosine oxidase, subunit beta
MRRDIPPGEFRDAVGLFATGVTVVATTLQDVLHGMTANAFASVSLDPLLILVCVEREAGLHDLVATAKTFAVTVLAEDQVDDAVWFASPRRPSGRDQFDGVPWLPGPVTGSPVLEEGIAFLDCRLAELHDGGDHSIFLGEVVDVGLLRQAQPLLFYAGEYHRVERCNVLLSLRSIEEFRRFEAEHGRPSGYRPIGYLLLVPEQQWADHLEGVAVQREAGAPVDVLTVAEAQRFGAFVTDDLAGATYGPIDGVVDPHMVTAAYVDGARRLGAEVRFGARVTAIESRHDGWHLATTSGTVVAGQVVNAAGPWAGEVAALAGLDVPVVPVRRNVYVTAPRRRARVHPLTVDLATGFYLRSEGDRLLFGRSNPDEPPGFTRGVDWDWLEPTLAAGIARFPWLAEETLDHRACWSGLYEVTPDRNPVLGRLPGVDGWVNACGFSGHGVQQAPAVGRVIAEEVLHGAARSIDIGPLRAERFRLGGGGRERHII